MSKLTTAIFNVLSDGEWHTSKEITDRACAMASAKRNNVAVALHDMTETHKIKRQQFGSTDHDYQYRMGTVSVGFGRSYNMAMLDSLLSTVRGHHEIVVHS
ncbi:MULTISPECIES: hypothetical protein [Pantoea]|uniref:hypothetical protein n=1 Tax=Pantoea TaxID=53335 RepID=UPI00257FE7F3|nr:MULTISPECIES: hypothetical protein [Pantoea]